MKAKQRKRQPVFVGGWNENYRIKADFQKERLLCSGGEVRCTNVNNLSIKDIKERESYLKSSRYFSVRKQHGFNVPRCEAGEETHVVPAWLNTRCKPSLILCLWSKYLKASQFVSLTPDAAKLKTNRQLVKNYFKHESKTAN